VGGFVFSSRHNRESFLFGKSIEKRKEEEEEQKEERN